MSISTAVQDWAPTAPSPSRTSPIYWELPYSINNQQFPIVGVKFEPANWWRLDRQAGCGAAGVIRPSDGSGVTDYVTHQADFSYSPFGVHVGQDDRLTFLGASQWITAHLIDCRTSSPTVGRELVLEFRASPRRVLIIPAGVAHTFDGLSGVVTRAEPVWYVDGNPDWEPDDDLISFPRTACATPLVRTNRHLLPEAAHLLVSRMSQAAVAKSHAAYRARYRVHLSGTTRYLNVAPGWSTAEPLGDWAGLPVRAQLSNLAVGGSGGCRILPSTDSCTSDVIEVRGVGIDSSGFASHQLYERLLTWLGGSGESWISFGDGVNRVRTRRFDDPRLTVRIPPGVQYRIGCQGTNWYRSEMRLVGAPTASVSPLYIEMRTKDVDDLSPCLVADAG
jgi:dTDP-4-dehydrorhamnose 3,5-epimerase